MKNRNALDLHSMYELKYYRLQRKGENPTILTLRQAWDLAFQLCSSSHISLNQIFMLCYHD